MRLYPFSHPMTTLTLLLLLAAGLGGCRKGPVKPSTYDAVRIDCGDRGIYKITGADLARLGVDLNTVDTKRMALVHNTTAVPFYGEGTQDGHLDPEDAIYFFSDGADEDNVTYVNLEKDFTPRAQRFMLRLGGSEYEPLRFKPVKMRTPAKPDPARYAVRTLSGRQHFEKNPIFRFLNVYGAESQANAETTGTAQTDFIFWAEMTQPATDKTSPSALASFDLPQADFKREMTLKVKLYAAADLAEIFEHRVAVSLNGKAIGDITWKNMRAHEAQLKIPAGVCAQANRIEFALQPPKLLSSAAQANKIAIDFVMLDWFEVEAKHATRVDGDEGEFLVRDAEDQQAAGRLALEGFSSKEIRVFDLGAREMIQATPFQSTDQSWAVNLERKARPTTLAALTEARMHSPIEMRRVTLTERFAQPSDCELLILTHPAFTKLLEPLVAWKRSRGLKTELVEITDLFNEATGGYAGPETLRRYIEHVYKSQPKPALHYVMLVGDAMSVSKYQTFCPAWSYLQSGRHANENYFAAFDGKPEGKPQVAVGRISANAPEQVAQAVRKIIEYESGKNAGPWQARLLTIAAAHQWARDDAQSIHEKIVHPNYLALKMQTDLTNKDPNYHEQVSKELSGRLNEGNLVTCFFGHGGGAVWEVGPAFSGSDFKRHLFDQERVAALTNRERLPLVCALTCYTNDFDNPGVRQTLGETFVNSPGGAIAVLGAAGRSSTMVNLIILHKFLTHLRDDSSRLGDAFRQTLIDTNSEYANMNYLLIGDPSLEFHFPRPDIKLTGARLDAATGTLTLAAALPPEIKTPATLECTVVDANDEIVAQWQAPLGAAKGTITRALGPGKLKGSCRIVAYLKDEHNASHVGSAAVDAGK